VSALNALWCAENFDAETTNDEVNHCQIGIILQKLSSPSSARQNGCVAPSVHSAFAVGGSLN
jgi:hypothetical protein